MDDYTATRKAVEGQGGLVLATLASLKEEQWKAPSRLPGWDMLTLAAHTMRALTTLIDYTAKPQNAWPVRDRISYWHFDGQIAATSTNTRARAIADNTTPAGLVTLFGEKLKEALVVLDRLEPATVITSLWGPMRLDEYATTRVVELTIHGMDLQASVQQPLRLDLEAQALTVKILEVLMGRPRPADLSDDIAFIEVASGRVKYNGIQLSAFS
jgi:uncharacterized protein (TIGR03083 family)